MKIFVIFFFFLFFFLFSNGQSTHGYLVGVSTFKKAEFHSFKDNNFFSLFWLGNKNINFESNDIINIGGQNFHMLYTNHISSWNMLSCCETDTTEIAWGMRFQTLKERFGTEAFLSLSKKYDSLFLNIQIELKKLFLRHSKVIRVRTRKLTFYFIPLDIEIHKCIYKYYPDKTQEEAVIKKIIKPYKVGKNEKIFFKRYINDLLKSPVLIDVLNKN